MALKFATVAPSLYRPFSCSQSLFVRITAHADRRRISHRPYHTETPPVRPLRFPSGYQSILPLVHSCTNLILPHNPCQSETPHIIASRNSEGAIIDEEMVVPFLISHDPSEKPVGYLRPQVVSALEDDHQKHLVSGSASPWDFRYSKNPTKSLKSLAFAEWVNEGGKFTRTMHMERIVLDWHKRKMFKELLKSIHPVSNNYPWCLLFCRLE